MEINNKGAGVAFGHWVLSHHTSNRSAFDLWG